MVGLPRPCGRQALGLRRLPFLFLLLAVRWAQIGAVKVTNYTPWEVCTAPPKTLQEKTGVRNAVTTHPPSSNIAAFRIP